MSTFIHKVGTGSLFQNQFKNKDSHPDYTGKIILSQDYKAGDVLKIAAWKKISINGAFLSLSENTFDKEENSNDEAAN
jgi:hypothetical protein